MSYQPRFEITARLLNFLTQTAELRLWITDATVDVPWLPALQKDTAERLAHSSTSIEGNPLSLEQVKLLAQGDSIYAQEKSKNEVLDYLNALKWVEKQTSEKRLTEEKLRLLHQKIVQRTLPQKEAGCYKTKLNRIVDGRGRTVYVPPSPEVVKKMTRELIAWINQSAQLKIHPLVVSAIAHHRLVSIHPFKDGNGRTSRALAIWILYTRGFDNRHLFALDEYFESNRQRYYEKIQQVRELDGILTYWLEYAAEGLVQTLEKTKERIDLLQVQAKDSKLVLTRRQEEVLRFIRERKKVGSADIGKTFRLTRSRVNQLLRPLVKAAVILQEGATRSTTYKIAPI